MISVTNMGQETKPGVFMYRVKVNREIITYFEHKREDGLAMCLAKASQAVAEKFGHRRRK